MTTPAVATQTLAPSSIEELAAMVRAHNRGAIYPVGCGSWQDLGYPPTKPGVAISTKGLNRVVDYPHEELTITVEAGILISDLQRILAEKGQMLPIDCPHPENATLGGLLATNSSGPRRLAYGTARDSVLGLDVIDATGTRIHGGGRVVKNVAGYDLPKMHIGALGTLGIIVEATLKVRPWAEKMAAIEFNMQESRTPDFLAKLRSSTLRPIAFEIGWNSRMEKQSWGGMMLFEGSTEAVAAQKELSAEVVGAFADGFQFEREPGFQTEYEVIVDYPNLLVDAKGNMGTKITVRPNAVLPLLTELRKSLAEPLLQADVHCGVVWGFWEATPLNAAQKDAQMIQRLAKQFEGRFFIHRSPRMWKRELPIWGDVGPEIEWMRRLRTALDPDRTLNPGRFVVE
jgi:glycolate oxidase FAD binding subunit